MSNTTKNLNIFNRDTICEVIQKGVHIDIPDLITSLKENNKKITCFSEPCEWLDIGRLDDYEEAVKLYETNEKLYLKETK